jgi:hypothetical protein
MAYKLKHGQEIKLNVPFIYTIGEEGPITGNVLETIEDCMEEVRAEIEQGLCNVDIVIEN